MRLILACLLEPDSNCIDVGASEGSMLAEIVRLSPSGAHIAYEPLPDEADRLVAMYPTVNVRRKAVTNQTGTMPFMHVTNGSGWSGLRSYEFGIAAQIDQIEVDCVRLDDDLPSGYRVSFIKVDVNGAEIEFFHGAINTLVANRPFVLFEHGIACRSYGHSPSDVYPILVDECGLKLFDLEGNGPLSLPDFRRALNEEAKWNFLAKP